MREYCRNKRLKKKKNRTKNDSLGLSRSAISKIEAENIRFLNFLKFHDPRWKSSFASKTFFIPVENFVGSLFSPGKPFEATFKI